MRLNKILIATKQNFLKNWSLFLVIGCGNIFLTLLSVVSSSSAANIFEGSSFYEQFVGTYIEVFEGITFAFYILFSLVLSYRIYYLGFKKNTHRYFLVCGLNRNEIYFSNRVLIFLGIIVLYLINQILYGLLFVYYDNVLDYKMSYKDDLFLSFNYFIEALLFATLFIIFYSLFVKMRNKKLLYFFLVIFYVYIWFMVVSLSYSALPDVDIHKSFYSFIPLTFSKITSNYEGVYKFINLIYFIVLFPIFTYFEYLLSKKYNY
ncbi:hypothetical protein SHELI_v1c04810 [Spiroplasma helicoides]|uniref:Uncharacterized protein n=1 Tax=Spiroplasma helicoides TaxID=216938 RepID=A0A1B3SKH3_9MOLU|nr:hypothetical protein [Spiroplasma helicoides]AOG60432.1 hypothetical protein SHELI_v1c04810 [Spiroplasma helicoides]